MQSLLSLCLFVTEPIAEKLSGFLIGERYRLTYVHSLEELTQFIEKHREQIDCLIIAYHNHVLPFFNELYEQGCLLPVILLQSEGETSLLPGYRSDNPTVVYHNAEIILSEKYWAHLPAVIDKAIAHYLNLGPSCTLPDYSSPQPQSPRDQDAQQSFLLLQQRRLADKLKERLGYLGVYYKRNPKYFYRNLDSSEKKAFREQMLLEYQEIILYYFSNHSDVDANQMIDQFVNQLFFADVSVSQILEIHMELMDEFSQQLKLEGRSEEILLDYRLVLIDILAHLGEMYRRSIPREDVPPDIYYPTD